MVLGIALLVRNFVLTHHWIWEEVAKCAKIIHR